MLELTVDGKVVASSSAMPFGKELRTEKGFWSPYEGWSLSSNSLVTGEYKAIGIDVGGASEQGAAAIEQTLQSLQQKLAQSPPPLDRHQLTGALLDAGLRSYFDITDRYSQWLASSHEVMYFRQPSYGSFQTKGRILSNFGTAEGVQLTGLLMDMDRMKSNVECRQNCWENWRDFNFSNGAMLSAFEHIIPEQLFSLEDQPAHAISAVKALSIASASGQRIYTIKASNLDTALSQLTINSAIKAEIRQAVLAGLEATVHQHPVDYQGWRGTGYVLINPDSGAGAYKISGGANGGALIDDQVTGAVGPLFTLLGMGADLGTHFFSEGPFSVLKRVASFLSMVTAIHTALVHCSGANIVVVLMPHLLTMVYGLLLGPLGLAVSFWLSFFLMMFISSLFSYGSTQLRKARC